MMRAFVLMIACGCGGAVRTPAPPPAAPIEHHVDAASGPQIYRQLGVNKLQRAANRQTFVLSIRSEHVTLVETDEVSATLRRSRSRITFRTALSNT